MHRNMQAAESLSKPIDAIVSSSVNNAASAYRTDNTPYLTNSPQDWQDNPRKSGG